MLSRTYRLDATADERITHVSGRAGTDGDVIYHVALRVLTADSRTRILALVPQARLVARALGIQDALGTAGLVRIADVFRQAPALTIVAHGVRAARGSSAWIGGRCCCNCDNVNIAEM